MSDALNLLRAAKRPGFLFSGGATRCVFQVGVELVAVFEGDAHGAATFDDDLLPFTLLNHVSDTLGLVQALGYRTPLQFLQDHAIVPLRPSPSHMH